MFLCVYQLSSIFESQFINIMILMALLARVHNETIKQFAAFLYRIWFLEIQNCITHLIISGIVYIQIDECMLFLKRRSFFH